MTGPYADAPSAIIVPRLDDYEGLKLAADWIRDLESSDSRLHKEKVIEKVMKERYVKENTIMVNLQNTKLFKKTKDGKYTLA